jgi:alpha-D-ribose 1-methylphosphonate 5-phosphate C-P lyase
MSISMADFDDPSFDVKAWVNAACAGCVSSRQRARG